MDKNCLAKAIMVCVGGAGYWTILEIDDDKN